jgi:AraC-like DNA-binding protein
MATPRRASSQAPRRRDRGASADPGTASAISGIAPGHLALDEIQPRVDVAAYWEFDTPQWHHYGLPSHHLLLIAAGSIRAVTPDGKLTAKAGDLVCFRPTPYNQYGNDEPLRYYQVHVEFAPPPRHQLTPWLAEVGPLPRRLALGGRFARARELFEAMCIAIVGGSAAERLRLRAAMTELLALIAEAAGSRGARGERLDPWQRARMRLESRLDQELPVPEVARELGLSADHFIRRFHQRFGVSPKLCRTQARLRFAAQRLRAGDGPIKAIARAIGMSDATAFARLFRRHFGVAPSEVAAGAAIADAGAGLVPANRHLVAPDEDPRWVERFRARPS